MKITAFLAGFLVVLASGADAQIGCDGLEDIGPNGTAVTSRVIQGVTVTISTGNGSSLTAYTYDSGPNAFNGFGGALNAPSVPGNVSYSRFISDSGPYNFESVGPITFDFSEPVIFFGVTTLDLHETGTSGSGTITLEAFDNLNSTVGVPDVRTGALGPSGVDFDWSVSGAGIVKVVFTGVNLTGYSGFGIDDLCLELDSVPVEEETWGAIKALFE